jgi:hypothetical protein
MPTCQHTHSKIKKSKIVLTFFDLTHSFLVHNSLSAVSQSVVNWVYLVSDQYTYRYCTHTFVLTSKPTSKMKLFQLVILTKGLFSYAFVSKVPSLAFKTLSSSELHASRHRDKVARRTIWLERRTAGVDTLPVIEKETRTYPDTPKYFYDDPNEDTDDGILLEDSKTGAKAKVLVSDGVVSSFCDGDGVELISYHGTGCHGGIECMISNLSLRKTQWALEDRTDSSASLKLKKTDKLIALEDDIDCHLRIFLENGKLSVNLHALNTANKPISFEAEFQTHLEVSSVDKVQFNAILSDKSAQADDKNDVVVTDDYDSIVLSGQDVSQTLACNDPFLVCIP